MAVFTLELEIDYPSETSLCTVALFPTDTSSPIFSEGSGRPYTGYLERIIRLTRRICLSCENGHFCCNECRAPAFSWAFACALCFFTKIIFKLTIDISMCKIILEVEYFIKSMIYQMLKFFKRIAYFISRDDPKTFILL